LKGKERRDLGAVSSGSSAARSLYTVLPPLTSSSFLSLEGKGVDEEEVERAGRRKERFTNRQSIAVGG